MTIQEELTLSELSQRLKVSERTLQREIKRGKLNAHKAGRKYLVSEEELNKYLNIDSEDLDRKIKKFCQSKKNEMVTLLQQLVAMPSDTDSPSGQEKTAKFIKKKLEEFGIRTVMHGAGESVTVQGSFGFADDGILLDCPLDTTPPGDIEKWTYAPFGGIIKEGKMYGRGTADCRGGMVCMIYSILALKEFIDEDKVRVELVFDGGEQNGAYYGIKNVLKRGLPVKAGIIGYAGSGYALSIGCRGYHRFTFTTHGQSAHTGSSSKPSINAISKMVKFINEVEKSSLGGEKNEYFRAGSRLTFAMIEGGAAINIVPDSCSAKLDVRTLPEQNREHIENHLDKIIQRIKDKDPKFDISYTYDQGKDGYVLNPTDKVVTSLQEAAKEVNQQKPNLIVNGPSHIGTILREKGIPAVVWGPRGGNIHTYNEFVDIDSLAETAEIYAKTVLKYFGIHGEQ